MKWIDLTEVLTEEGADKLNAGDVLFFDKAQLKIMRKAKGKIWGKETYLYKPDEVEIKDKVEDEVRD